MPKLVGVSFKLTEKGKLSVVCSCSPQNLKFGHFTLLFCGGRQRNVPKFKMHVRIGAIVFVQMLLLPSSLLNRVPKHIWRSDKNALKIITQYCSYDYGPYKNFKTFVVARNIRTFKTCTCSYSPSAWKQSGANALHVHGSKTK